MPRGSVPGFVLFAVGRTNFWDPLGNWRSDKSTRKACVAEIARRYHECVAVFDEARHMVSNHAAA
jgi:myo-inositol catabolism protein IolC